MITTKQSNSRPNNEINLIKHHLEFNSSAKEKKYRGSVDYFSPTIQLILKEEPTSNYSPHTLEQDIADCVSCLKHLALAIRLSTEFGRANRNVALHVYAANENLVKKRTHESIGKDITWRKVRRAVIHRYVNHYGEWSKAAGPSIINPITPEKVLAFCHRHANTQSELYILMADLRLALFKLVDHLHSLSILEQHRRNSVYLASIDFLSESKLPFAFDDLLNHATK